MFVNGMYLSVLYCLCYDTNISKDILEEQVVEERDLDLNNMEDIGKIIGEISQGKSMIRRRFMP